MLKRNFFYEKKSIFDINVVTIVLRSADDLSYDRLQSDEKLYNVIQ